VVADIGKTRTRAPKPPKKLIEEELSVQVLRGIKRKHKPEGVKRLHSSSSPRKRSQERRFLKKLIAHFLQMTQILLHQAREHPSGASKRQSKRLLLL